jgi:hypothetical protein
MQRLIYIRLLVDGFLHIKVIKRFLLGLLDLFQKKERAGMSLLKNHPLRPRINTSPAFVDGQYIWTYL